MKKIISIIALLTIFSSCQNEVQFNNPGFQAQKDGVFWRAIDSKATLSTSTGILTITGYTEHETLTLTTNSKNVGTYVLGTTNQLNKALYEYSDSSSDVQYQTIPFFGSVNKLNLTYTHDNTNGYYYILNSGLGYTANPFAITTTTGNGVGLVVSTAVTSGVVTRIQVQSTGNNYYPGDLITIDGGTTNATFNILNTVKSNGEVVISNYDGATITGTFKFNAVKIDPGNLDPTILNYDFGTFYKIPVTIVP